MMKPLNRIRLSALFSLCVISTSASAGHAPGHSRFEWGMGIASLSIPDYLGSETRQGLMLPYPYIKYRGEHLIIDEGVEARLFDSPDLKLSISGNGSLSSSDDNPRRVNMDKLETAIELGPSLEYRMRQTDHSELWLELPYRFAVTLESSPEHIGNTLHPRIAWRKPAQQKYDWKLRMATGPVFSDADYHGYFFDVNASNATADRPAFNSGAGLTAWRTDFSFSRRVDNWWMGGFMRLDYLGNSKVEDSPLIESNTSLSIGFGIAWVFSEH